MSAPLRRSAISSNFQAHVFAGWRKENSSMFRLTLTGAAITSILVMLSSCATLTESNIVASEHLIIGPKGYTVDWGIPVTDHYWIPNETEQDIKSATDACNAPPSVFVWHHIPRPPWFSALGLNFPVDVDEQQKSCVVARLKAVPALTVYSKRN